MRDGKKYFIDFDHGRKGWDEQIGTVPLSEHGTIVHFADPDILPKLLSLTTRF